MKKILTLFFPLLLTTVLLIFPSCEKDDSTKSNDDIEIKEQWISATKTYVIGDLLCDFPNFNSLNNIIEIQITDQDILALTYDQDGIKASMEVGIDKFNSTIVIPDNEPVFVEYIGTITGNIIRFACSGKVSYYDGDNTINKSLEIIEEVAEINHNYQHPEIGGKIGSGHFHYSYRVNNK